MSKGFSETHNYPLNRSTSKQLYSFSKSIRFETTRPPFCGRAFYDIKKGAFNSRTTSFGYGNKLDMTNRQPVPPVGNYELTGQFLINEIKNRGYSFSKDNKCQTINPEKSAAIPGPGTYNHVRQKSADKYTTLSFSMGAKLDDPINKHQNPLGPGQYEPISTISSSGKYFYSKYGNSGCRIIGRAPRKPINESSITPGPGKYHGEETVSMNKTGIYFSSKFRNMEASRFGRSNRPSLGDMTPNPGPGHYGQFSEFARINKSSIRASTSGK